MDGQDILDDLGQLEFDPALSQSFTSAIPRPSPSPVPTSNQTLSEPEAAILNILPSGEALLLDEISSKTGFATSVLLTNLMKLEMKRLLIQHPGQRFQRR